MTALYQQQLAALRQAFPAPVSDPVHDGYVVFSLLRTLDRVDALKTQAPILGTPREPDYAIAALAELPAEPQALEAVIPQLVHVLDGMLITAHPRSQVNVVAPPSIASVIGVVLPSMYNPNLCSDESGRGFSEAEVRVASIAARLIGYDPTNAGGAFTFGGTGTLLYGLKIGLEKALPGTLEKGVGNRELGEGETAAGTDRPTGAPIVLCSEQGHYACTTVAAWLGIGHQNVIRVASQRDNSIDAAALEVAARQQLAAGRPIAAFVATMGTTDAFGIDDLVAIHALRERLVNEFKLSYRPHIHADAVIGWAWSMFSDYSFAENSLGFRGRTVRALAAAVSRIRHLALADSVGIDFHKTGFAPYISSLFLLRDRADFGLIARERETMPYLYHTGQYHPGMFTLETTRSATGVMAALANLLLLGKAGFRTLIGHAVEMAEVLRELIISRPELSILNDQNYGPVTLFRAYPPGVDTFRVKECERSDPSFTDELRRHNELNRRVYQRVAADALAGRGVAIGFTDNYRLSASGEPICALKSYVLSPFANEEQMHAVVEHVLAACRAEHKEPGASQT
jgi:glutamate/tyrosine decarboxylase-like PLP-dependent enzyme